MRGRLELAMCILLAAPLGASGQGPPPECARTTQQRLGAFAGHWHVETMFRSGTAAWDSTTAVAVITPELSGCLLREEYRGERGGLPYAYVALWGAHGLEPETYQRAFGHSQHGLLVLRAGSMAGDTLVLRSTTEVHGEDVLEEDRITLPGSSGTFMLVNRRSTDGGRTWTVTRRSRYTRLSESGESAARFAPLVPNARPCEPLPDSPTRG